MSRSDADSWDLGSSVGATATMVAAARALASQQADPLIVDPYAAPLVRAVGMDFFTKLVDGEITAGADGGALDGGDAQAMTEVIAVRTRFFDDFFLDSTAAGIRQAVILASGLDARAYRLPWPKDTVVYEIDQPRVIEAKSATMASLGAHPTAERRAVAVDLRDDWPAALVEAGFDATAPTAWSAEGLLIYLPPAAQDRLFDDLTSLSVPGSRLATEYHPDGGAAFGQRANAVSSHWREQGFDVDLGGLIFEGERTPVIDYLEAKGWRIEARTRPEVFAGYGRTFPDADVLIPQRKSLSVTATLT